VLLACFCAAAHAQQNYRTTPVPILKQINRHNDDGSYTYGYEGADGTFKIETKYSTGEVHGKYGYVGDDGKVREIEYGASKRGFEPAGTGINVPPPTLSQQTDANSLDYDDGQYKEDPAVYNKYARKPAFRARQQAAPVAAPAPTYYNPPTPAPQQYRSFNHQPAYSNPIFTGHPATNVNLQTGSYSLSYSG